MVLLLDAPSKSRAHKENSYAIMAKWFYIEDDFSWREIQHGLPFFSQIQRLFDKLLDYNVICVRKGAC